jgi:glucosamine-6-phosphate deaminase
MALVYVHLDSLFKCRMLGVGGEAMTAPIRELKVDRLNVKVFADRAALGLAAGLAAAARIRAMQQEQGQGLLNLLFAAAPSQEQTLEALRQEPGIDWGRIEAFHMDEYLGLPPGAPQSFGGYLKDRLFDRLPFHRVFYIDGSAADAAAECERYARLLREHPLGLVFLGIGENGHLAFNDPGVADFQDPLWVKINGQLDAVCRQQQVNDGQFRTLAEVPTRAITLTIPALFSARGAMVAVPGVRKRDIVRRTLQGPIDESCPATILRRHANACLFLDRDSAALL